LVVRSCCLRWSSSVVGSDFGISVADFPAEGLT
jgi:hypothetical protein